MFERSNFKKNPILQYLIFLPVCCFLQWSPGSVVTPSCHLDDLRPRCRHGDRHHSPHSHDPLLLQELTLQVVKNVVK